MKRSVLLKLREMIEKAAISLADDDAVEVAQLFPMWKPNQNYTIGFRLQWEGKLYRVVQPHTSQEGWEPDKTPALFTEVPKPGTIPEWKQPTGSQDAYMTGDKVRHNSKVWVCDIDYNVYEPGVYGWTEQ